MPKQCQNGFRRVHGRCRKSPKYSYEWVDGGLSFMDERDAKEFVQKIENRATHRNIELTEDKGAMPGEPEYIVSYQYRVKSVPRIKKLKWESENPMDWLDNGINHMMGW